MARTPFPIAYIAVPASEPLLQPQQSSRPLQLRSPGFTESQRKAVTGLGAAQIVIGLSSIAIEAVAVVSSTGNFYAGFWCGPFFLVTGIVACIAANSRKKTGPIVGTMVMSIISTILLICQVVFSLGRVIPAQDFKFFMMGILLIALGASEFFLSIACAAYCCRAVCRRCCCCEIIEQSHPEQINQNPFVNQPWTANPSQPNVSQQAYSSAPSFPLQFQPSSHGPSETSGQGAATVGGGSSDGAGPSSLIRA